MQRGVVSGRVLLGTIRGCSLWGEVCKRDDGPIKTYKAHAAPARRCMLGQRTSEAVQSFLNTEAWFVSMLCLLMVVERWQHREGSDSDAPGKGTRPGQLNATS